MPKNREITRQNKKKYGCGLPFYREITDRKGRRIADPTAYRALRPPHHGIKDYD
jgi:hypothetical protein